VREVVVFVEDPPDTGSAEAGEDIFAEMEPFTVKAGDVDYSRDSLYSRQSLKPTHDSPGTPRSAPSRSYGRATAAVGTGRRRDKDLVVFIASTDPTVVS
jgi:hypothetical protein